MAQGRIRRVPYDVDMFLGNLKTSEELPNLKMTFIKLKDYAIIGKETVRLAKNFGIKVMK